LKPENILFDNNGYIKLTDFGIARTWSPNNSSDTSGTPGYMGNLLFLFILNIAPEVVNGKPHGFTADYWALGIIIYELMMGKRPYPGIHKKEYKEKLLSSYVQIKSGEQPNNWSDDCRDIANSLLQKKVDERLGEKGIQQIKDHPWFKDVNWAGLLSMTETTPFIPASVLIILFI
jgi:serine/threonine protein kinase